MFNIIPLLLILISLIIIISIVVKKFSTLAALDVKNIQEEREAKFKERIMSNRLKREYFKYYVKVAKIFRPIGEAVSNFFRGLYRRLVEFKENYHKETSLILDGEAKIKKLLIEAGEMAKNGEQDEAEKRYIEIISMDSKNIEAFRSLGQLYLDEKKYQDAEQTFAHALKLIEKKINQPEGLNAKNLPEEINNQLAEIYFDLAEVCVAKSNLAEAIQHLNEALEAIPNSPRYLDMKLEISIMNKDKNSAEAAYEKLLAVNPENQKLADFKKQIEEI
jgi:tetratricopeptide (TPR) repeat protein